MKVIAGLALAVLIGGALYVVLTGGLPVTAFVLAGIGLAALAPR
jgi:hypothetical protein